MALIPADSQRLSVPTFRRRMAFSVGVLCVVLFVVVVLLNLLFAEFGRRVEMRFDITDAAWHSLEDTTRSYLRGVNEEIEIYLVYGDDERTRLAARFDAATERVDPVILRDVYRPFVATLAQGVQSMFGEMRHVNPRLRLFTNDDQSRFEMVKEWASRLGLSGSQLVNNVVFRNPRTDVTQSISLWKMYDVDMGGPNVGSRAMPLVRGDFIEPAALHGIKSVLNPSLVKVYFTQGRGEGEFPGIDQILRAENFETARINLDQTGLVPMDCGVLLIGSPAEEWSEVSRRALSDYLKRGGRVLLSIGKLARERFLQVLEEYGLAVDFGQIRHVRHSVAGQGPGALYGWDFLKRHRDENSLHPITEKIVADDHPVLMGFTRGFRLSADFDREKKRRVILGHSGDGAEIFPFVLENGDVRVRPDLVRREDQVPFLFALESRSSTADQPDSRLVVAGSSDWLTLEPLTLGFSLGNRDLLLNSMFWLCDRENETSSTPRTFRGRLAPLTRDTMMSFGLIIRYVFPGLLILVGGLIWTIRQRQK